MATYTPTQIMLALAYIVDVGAKLKENTCQEEQDLHHQINQHLQSVAPVKDNWQLVWGPCVFKFPLIAKYRDNTVFVVQNKKDKTQYALALSGTNPWEITDWLFEDFLVAGMLPWTYGQRPAGAKISLSAALSLSILHNLKPCQSKDPKDHLPGAGLRLMDFLKQARDLSSLTVTGHSLGGEMASTAALWLVDTQGDLWDQHKKAKVSAYCYAGPTAGNSQWVNYFHERLGDNAHRIWNSLDVVPHVWQVSTLEQIPDLYLPQIEPPLWAKPLLDTIILSVKDKNYTQIQAVKQDKQPLIGKINTIAKSNPFVNQMLYQHVAAYPELLHVDLTPLTDVLHAKANPPKLA